MIDASTEASESNNINLVALEPLNGLDVSKAFGEVGCDLLRVVYDLDIARAVVVLYRRIK